MTLTEDKSPEANLDIGMNQYALQRHERDIIYIGGVLVGRRLNIWHIAD